MNKILIIDDEPALRQTLAAILKRSGYSPTMAGTKQEGMQKLQEDTYSLLFLDIKLPDGLGIEMLPEIHQLNPDMPVIILTAHATLDAAMQAVRGGARDFLLKPIDPAAILERVSQVLAESKEPKRQKEIISQVQDLLAELGSSPPPAPHSMTTKSEANDPNDPNDGRFISCGSIRADLHTRHLMIDDNAISLPSSSFDYVVTLMRYSPEAVSFENLVMESQGYSCTKVEARDITRWHIHKIRKAIEKDTSDPQHLITVRDVGYRLVG